MQTATDKDIHSDIGKRLILLVEKEKSASAGESVYRLVRIEYEAIRKARESLLRWKEIADTCGFPGKEAQMRNAFRLERRRREKKKGEVKTVPAQKIENEKQKNEAIAAPTKTNGGRIGPPKPIGRGRLDLGCDAEDDEL